MGEARTAGKTQRDYTAMRKPLPRQGQPITPESSDYLPPLASNDLFLVGCEHLQVILYPPRTEIVLPLTTGHSE
uniref:Uncharacterized protein n=1 Tax=Strigops habroptila TaxID=2489341 RepID=A0A672U109_STRHB